MGIDYDFPGYEATLKESMGYAPEKLALTTMTRSIRGRRQEEGAPKSVLLIEGCTEKRQWILEKSYCTRWKSQLRFGSIENMKS